jgi:ubiquinone/menaquinone biosynthesis C-methylase UbiE
MMRVHPLEVGARMNPFRMMGSWPGVVVILWNKVVAPALAEVYRQKVGQYLPGQTLPPGSRVLDVGCGTGHLTSLLARQYSTSEVIGLDLSPVMIELARRRYRSQENLSFCQGDAMDLPYPDGSFDVAISMASIKHWPDPGRGLAEMGRVLRPGGTALIMEGNPTASRAAACNFVSRWRWMPGFMTPVLAWYLRHFVLDQGLFADALWTHLSHAGFQEIDLEALDDLPALIARATRPK